MNYQNLIELIETEISTNHRKEITGLKTQNVLKAVVEALGRGYQFMGIAIPDSNPETTDARVFYIAITAGVYEHYGEVELTTGNMGIITYDTDWHISEIPQATNAVSDEIIKRIKVGENQIADVQGEGTGWTREGNSYTHASGNADRLVFDLSTINGKSYLVIIGSANNHSYGEGKIFVRIGESEPCDIYNGSDGPFHIGIISSGGKLNIECDSSVDVTLTDIELREIVDENESEIIELVPNNVQSGTMRKNITGWWNVAIGSDNALAQCQNGSRNIAIGYRSLSGMKSGERNIGIGTYTLRGMLRGVRNVAIGNDALGDAEYPQYNLAIGGGSLYRGGLGFGGDVLQNIAVGLECMKGGAQAVTYNTAIGNQALANAANQNENVTQNVAIGYQANRYASQDNVAIGYRAADYTRGKGNVHIGCRCTRTFVNTNHCVLIGNLAYASTGNESSSNIETIENAIAIGYQAVAKKSNQCVIGNANVTEFVLGGKVIEFNNDNSVTWRNL